MADIKNTEQEQVIKDYVKSINEQKKKMVDEMSKEDMVNLIFKQNNLLAQQSSQMLEVVNLANHIETSSREDEARKCSTKSNSGYSKGCVLQKQQLNIYENSIRIQIVLFILLISIDL